MGTMVSQITCLMIVYSTFYLVADQEKQLRVTGLFTANLPVTGKFPVQMDSNAENVSIWWQHHVKMLLLVGVMTH